MYYTEHILLLRHSLSYLRPSDEQSDAVGSLNQHVTISSELSNVMLFLENLKYFEYENHDIAIAMSPTRADPVLGLNILLHRLGAWCDLQTDTHTHRRTQLFIVKDSSLHMFWPSWLSEHLHNEMK